MFSFQSKLIKTDVTSIKLTNNYVFCGIGDTLFIFNQISNKPLKKMKIFDGDNIQGIEFNPSKTLLSIYGGILIKIFEGNIGEFDYRPMTFCATNDWILTMKWLKNSDDFVIVHMNNTITLYDKDINEKKIILCEEKCILYSACICNVDWGNLVILSGTVFNEILIWKPSEHDTNGKCSVVTRLKEHNGVIFSICYDGNLGYICSSSDDRSSVLWAISSKKIEEELKNPSVIITKQCKVYGHESRVYRCRILKNYFITAGEDSVLNIWSFNGKLLRSIQTHQGSSIWALDSDGRIIISGGADGGISIFLTNVDINPKKIIVPNGEIPKHLKITKTSHLNLVLITETGLLCYYLLNLGNFLPICHHHDLRTYSLLEISNCGKLISLSGYQGQIYIYKALENRLEFLIKYETPEKERIFSFHWLSCNVFIICGPKGTLSLYHLDKKRIKLLYNFTLPKSRERWSTSACLIPKERLLIGDRNGNMFLYRLNKVESIQILKKIHSHLGVTQLYFSADNEIVSLGRNSILNTFRDGDDYRIESKSSNKVPFKWLTNYDHDSAILSGFSSSSFVIWDLIQRRTLLELPCGGGHRSWSYFNDKSKLNFSFIKDKAIFMFEKDWKSIQPIDLVPGYHSSEINSIKIINSNSNYILISGGEDTSLRICLVDYDGNFKSVATLKSHLSSIRAIEVSEIIKDESYLIVSGGGRAQIICWKLSITNSDVSCSQECSFYECVASEDAEVRIMDLKIVANRLFSACSDGSVRIFQIDCIKGRFQLHYVQQFRHKFKCIIKIHIIPLWEQLVLFSMATDGFLSIWNVTNCQDSGDTPFKLIPVHQSGINSCSFKFIDENLLLCVTGGDDNAVIVQLMRIPNFEVISKFSDCGTHCAQITGTFIGDDYFLTASIDQKVSFFSWKLKSNHVICQYLNRYNSAIADIQGIQCFSNSKQELDLFLYGKGIEYVHCIK